jgi:hypothetical protein
MQTNAQQAPAEAADPVESRLLEAAYYALLRRLAPTIRHHMVGDLQPMGMICATMERRMKNGSPDLANIQENIGKIDTLSRAAVKSCLGLMSWVAPEEKAISPLDAAVQDCMGLLKNEFGFRGYSITTEVGEQPLEVSRSAVRHGLSAVLVALSDEQPGPFDLHITAEMSVADATLYVQRRHSDGAAPFTNAGRYRTLEWRDVQAIAAAEGMGLARQDDRVTLRFPLALPAK